MPNDKGELSPEEREKIAAWFKDKGTILPCTFCGVRDWVLNDSLLNLMIYYKEGWRIGGPTVPATVLYCKKCGHFEFFSAVLMGLVESAPKEPPLKADEGKVANDNKQS